MLGAGIRPLTRGGWFRYNEGTALALVRRRLPLHTYAKGTWAHMSWDRTQCARCKELYLPINFRRADGSVAKWCARCRAAYRVKLAALGANRGGEKAAGPPSPIDLAISLGRELEKAKMRGWRGAAAAAKAKKLRSELTRLMSEEPWTANSTS